MLKYGEICRIPGIKGALGFIFFCIKKGLYAMYFKGFKGGFIKICIDVI